MERKRLVLLVIIIILAALPACTDTRNISFYSGNYGYLSENVLRLHIRAASNSEEDQNTKLALRDAVLKEYSGEFAKYGSFAEATESISKKTGEINEFVNTYLRKNGIDYESSVTVGKSRFPDRTYDNIFFPAGEYTALRIDLGSGSGENWWCVMYPPLCFVNVHEDEDTPAQTDSDADKVEARSWLAEFFEGLFD